MNNNNTQLMPQAHFKGFRIAILGGGPAGLFAGYFAKKAGLPFDIYEASERIGGNCKTFQFGDFRFDSGAHRFHDRDAEMTEEILALMGDRISQISAPSFIYHKGKLLHFPITPGELLTKLPLSTILRSGFQALTAPRSAPAQNFREYVYRKYGKSIADLFITNYSAKLWGVETENLSTKVAGNRLKNINISSLVNEFLHPKKKAKHMEGAFYYPQLGFGEIAETVANFCGRENIHTNSPVTRIIHDGSRINGFEINENEFIPTSYLASSLPLSVFINLMHPAPPDAVFELASSIRFRHLKLVCMFIDKPTINKAATLYFPDRKYLFTRAYEPRNRSPLMSPEGKTSLMVEIPYSFGDEVETMSDEALFDHVSKHLVKSGLMTHSEIMEMTVKHLPYAYPVLEKDYDKKIESLNAYFDRFPNLYLTGRNGKFVYSWTHNMMRYGKRFVDRLTQLEETALAV
jgi:protoporphyrinogen oxidase